MKKFLDEDFLLESRTARKLYHEFAADLPVIDYHCHLPVKEIAHNINFANLTQAWLNGDHYKWRAMRANGVSEEYITGSKNDFEKFEKWAKTVPYTLRNPLYHWTHLELKRYFKIDKELSPRTAKKIYKRSAKKLQSQKFSVRKLLLKMNVEIVCTTDDPVDSLEYHKKLRDDGFKIKVLPAFRPDNAMKVDDPQEFNTYLDKLASVSNVQIDSFQTFLDALKRRHDFFAAMGCTVSDHGSEYLYTEHYTDGEIELMFDRIRMGIDLSAKEKLKFRSALLYVFAIWDHEKGWVQQYHLGALRNNNQRMLQLSGPDSGYDSIGDFQHGRALSKFLNRLDSTNQLTKTILYNLNPADNELFAAMTGNFNDGTVAGKIQFGSAWWFLDQRDGMEKQMNALSNIGLISRFVGMITDSRSFLSYPRHEYFRRILCNLFGNDIENGLLPNDIKWTGKIVQDVCYYNAKKYFGW